MPDRERVIEVAREWVGKAENDLIAAAYTLRIGAGFPTDTVCFHAQQCVEKYLKAFIHGAGGSAETDGIGDGDPIPGGLRSDPTCRGASSREACSPHSQHRPKKSPERSAEAEGVVVERSHRVATAYRTGRIEKYRRNTP